MNKTTDANRFEIRSYSFMELACMYNPGNSAQSASRTLTRWIRDTRGLKQALIDKGWRPYMKILPPLLVGCIVGFLGEP
ncbi:MAG: DUF4248 domain-containing protein [Tannerellaceae bacterium]